MKYAQRIVRIGKGLAPSGRALHKRLLEEGYDGEPINWGHRKYPGLNMPEAIALSSNKKRALFTLQEAGVPTPQLYRREDIYDAIYPIIGRTDYHTRGSGFWFCDNEEMAERAAHEGATHFLEYIGDAREFRVHVMGEASLKISDKDKRYDSATHYFREGSWRYPHDFRRKKSLRQVAVRAVEALGLDFGAVDVLYKRVDDEPCFFVLEVNTAPCLTESINNDTLERYVQGFLDNLCNKGELAVDESGPNVHLTTQFTEPRTGAGTSLSNDTEPSRRVNPLQRLFASNGTRVSSGTANTNMQELVPSRRTYKAHRIASTEADILRLQLSEDMAAWRKARLEEYHRLRFWD